MVLDNVRIVFQQEDVVSVILIQQLWDPVNFNIAIRITVEGPAEQIVHNEA